MTEHTGDVMDYRNMNDEALRAACGDDAGRWFDAWVQESPLSTPEIGAQMRKFIENVIEGSHDARAKVRAARGYPDKED